MDSPSTARCEHGADPVELMRVLLLVALVALTYRKFRARQAPPRVTFYPGGLTGLDVLRRALPPTSASE